MRTKTYKWGKTNYRSYFKTVGKGFEVGFTQGTKTIFVGNFIKQTEAKTWYEQMNKELSRFSKKFYYDHGTQKSMMFYNKFVSTNLYKHYYDYLDKCFGKYTRTFSREFSRDLKAYKRMYKGQAGRDTAHHARQAA